MLSEEGAVGVPPNTPTNEHKRERALVFLPFSVSEEISPMLIPLNKQWEKPGILT